MEKKDYHQIRLQLDAKPKLLPLLVFFLQDLFIVSSIFGLNVYLPGFPGAALSAPLWSVMMFRNFSLMHDGTHGVILKTKRLNNLLGVWTGAVAILPFEPWRRVHLKHHFWAGNLDEDPVMLIVTAFPGWPKALRQGLNFAWKAWVPLIAGLQYVVFWFRSFQELKKSPFSSALIVSLVAPAMFWAILAWVLPKSLLLGGVLPGIWGYLLLAEVVNLPHHLELPHTHGETKLQYKDQHQVARSCFYPKWFAEKIVLNFNLHAEHHMYPWVPWYQLQKLSDLVQPRINASEKQTDSYFEWIVKNRPRDLEEVLKAHQPVERKSLRA